MTLQFAAYAFGWMIWRDGVLTIGGGGAWIVLEGGEEEGTVVLTEGGGYVG